MSDDRQVIERVLAGDTAAFRLLVEAHQTLVYQFARNMSQSVQDAEDLTQDVFVAAFQNLRTYDSSKSSVSTWLLTIARNRCCNDLKKRRATTPGDVDGLDRQSCPDDEATSREIWRGLDRALELLPTDQRTAFVLAEIQELPHAEIAAIEGIEIGTVKSRVSRARERLRQAMRAWQPDPKPAGLPPRSNR